MATMYLRPLAVDDLDAVKRLHKFAQHNGRPVFGQYGDDAAQVLKAAAAAEQGAFGLVALLSDPDEPEDPEVVGAVTAQLVTHDSNSSATRQTTAAKADPAAAGQQQEGAECSSSELVLLTLVVRADARKQGVGQQLLQGCIKHAQQLAIGQPLQQVVTDIALNNKPAWQLFERCGFQRSTAGPGESTAEAVLLLEPLTAPAAAAGAAAAAAGASEPAGTCQATAASASHQGPALCSCSRHCSSSSWGRHLATCSVPQMHQGVSLPAVVVGSRRGRTRASAVPVLSFHASVKPLQSLAGCVTRAAAVQQHLTCTQAQHGAPKAAVSVRRPSVPAQKLGNSRSNSRKGVPLKQQAVQCGRLAQTSLRIH